MSTAPVLSSALMSAQMLPAPEASEAPEWVHLLPARTGAIQTGDDRGPYHVDDADALIADSFAETGKLAIDQDHATDLAAPKGLPAPARGWIVEMQARDDGIWGRVEWTREGAALLADRAYRALSPVILHDKSKRIVRILRASLVNRPNLRGLVALNQQQEPSTMDFMAKLAELLGLEAGADEAAITAAIEALKKPQDDEPELQAQLGEIGKALGCDDGADAAAVLSAAKVAAEGDDTAITALQSELAEVTTSLNALKEAGTRTAAETFVDTAIREGRVGVKPQRDRFIAMHMRDPAEAEAVITGLPKLGATATSLQPPVPNDGSVALNAEQARVARMLGQDPKDYAAALQAELAAEQESF